MRFDQWDDIMEQQFTIGYLSKGGLTYADTEAMSVHERRWMFNRVVRQVQEENDRLRRATDGR